MRSSYAIGDEKGSNNYPFLCCNISRFFQSEINNLKIGISNFIGTSELFLNDNSSSCTTIEETILPPFYSPQISPFPSNHSFTNSVVTDFGRSMG
jgi:hypothetical protein